MLIIYSKVVSVFLKKDASHASVFTVRYGSFWDGGEKRSLKISLQMREQFIFVSLKTAMWKTPQ